MGFKTTIPNTGSGINRHELWKFLTPPGPDEIELDQTEGATGINAVNPQATQYKLIHSLVGGLPASYFTKTGTLAAPFLLFSGIGDNKTFMICTDISVPRVAQIMMNNSTIIKSVDTPQDSNTNTSTQLLEDLVLTDLANLSSQRQQTSSSIREDVIEVGVAASSREQLTNNITDQVSDLATGDNSVVFSTPGVTRITTENGATNEEMRFEVGSGDVVIQDEVNNRLFSIQHDGKIRTNQTQAPGVHVVLSAELPIYDAFGVLVGFIPVMTV